jgi:hypothetical protein
MPITNNSMLPSTHDTDTFDYAAKNVLKKFPNNTVKLPWVVEPGFSLDPFSMTLCHATVTNIICAFMPRNFSYMYAARAQAKQCSHGSQYSMGPHRYVEN